MLGLKLINVSKGGHWCWGRNSLNKKQINTAAGALVCPGHQQPWDWMHYDDVIMSTIASQITSLTIVYSTVYSGADQRKYQSSAWLAFVWWIHRGPVNSPHKWPVTRKMFPFDDVIMYRIKGCLSSIRKCLNQLNRLSGEIIWNAIFLIKSLFSNLHQKIFTRTHTHTY